VSLDVETVVGVAKTIYNSFYNVLNVIYGGEKFYGSQ
jgi:hypothetical protein